MTRPNLGVVIVSGAIALIALIAIAFDGERPPEFDCARDEVGVWVNYGSREMTCVDADDHEAHQGDHDG